MRLALAVFALSVMACSNLEQDSPAAYTPDPLGTGLRLADVQNPKSPHYRPGSVVTPPTVTVSSAVVTWLDTFDETKDGKSAGTLYVQDVGSQAPFAGMGVYAPNYIPASLSVLPGDVLDLTGPYEESPSVGTAIFTTGTFLPQLFKPVATYRYEFETPCDPTGQPPRPCVTVPIEQLDGTASNFPVGRQWLGMLVTLQDVEVTAGVTDRTGLRVTYNVSHQDGTASPAPVQISNENYALGTTDYPAGTKFKSVTGIVTWFYSFHVAPRSPADLVQ